MLLGVKRTSTGGNPVSAFDAKRTATLAGDRNRGVSKAFSCRAACGNDMSKRILVVDDQPDNRQIIRDMLAPTDYEITEAENGELALAAIAKQRPDLILMDIQLPIMDGYTATSRIKSDPKCCDRSQSSRLPPMRLAVKKGRRGQWAAMTACRNRSARANCCRKFGSTCPNRCNRLLHCICPLLTQSGHRHSRRGNGASRHAGAAQTAFKSCIDYWSSLIPSLRTSGVQRATSSDMNSLNRSAVQSDKGSTTASIRDC